MMKRYLGFAYFIILSIVFACSITRAQVNLIYTQGYNDFQDPLHWGKGSGAFNATDTTTFTATAGWTNFGMYSRQDGNDLLANGIEYKFQIILDAGSPAIDLYAIDAPVFFGTGELIGHIVPGFNEFIYTAGATYHDIFFRDIAGVNATYKFNLLKVMDNSIVPIAITYPIGGEVFIGTNSVNIQFDNAIGYTNDSLKIYYSTDAGSSWNFIVKVDTSQNSYSWTVPDLYSAQGRIRITTDDSVLVTTMSSSFTILPSDRMVEILDPTITSQTVFGNLLKVTVMSFNVARFNAYYSKNGGSYSLIDDSISVDAGDGDDPDTTIFYWDISSINLTGVTSIKVSASSDTIFQGSSSVAYYSKEGYTFAGLRAMIGQAQAKNFWSDMFIHGDQLYTSSFYAYIWGWYDYSDKLSLYRWNTATDSFQVYQETPTPGSCYYPRVEAFRSSSTNFVMWSSMTGTYGNYKSAYKTANMFGSMEWSADVNTTTKPTSIDVGNTIVVYNAWRYILSPSTLRLTAEDLNNPGNTILVFDDLDAPMIEANNIDFYVFDNLIIISRREGAFTGNQESGFGSSVWIVGDAFPLNSIAAEDAVSFVLQGVKRNFYRGIYPNAIIQYFPPER